jgi:PleD family two-component response regulator
MTLAFTSLMVGGKPPGHVGGLQIPAEKPTLGVPGELLMETARRRMTMPKAEDRHRILFVDDEPSHLKSTRLILEDAGFEVQTAATGQEALQLARQILPDIILLDVVLPDTTGYDVCQQLKMDPDTMDTVVLLLSGLG